MITYTADPVMDEMRWTNHLSAAAEQWEQEHYRGKCPLCGKPMYEGSDDWLERCEEDYDRFEDGWVHTCCFNLLKEEEADDSNGTC